MYDDQEYRRTTRIIQLVVPCRRVDRYVSCGRLLIPDRDTTNTADLYAHHEHTEGRTDERRYLMTYEQIFADDRRWEPDLRILKAKIGPVRIFWAARTGVSKHTKRKGHGECLVRGPHRLPRPPRPLATFLLSLSSCFALALRCLGSITSYSLSALSTSSELPFGNVKR